MQLSGPLLRSSSLTLKRSSAWAIVGHATYGLSQWGILVVLARVSSPADVGRYALGLAVAAPVMLLTSLVLSEVQATDVGGQYRFANYLGMRLATTTVAMLLVALVVVVGGITRTNALVVFLIAVAKGMDSISEVFHGAVRRVERMDLAARGLVANGAFSLIAVVLLAPTLHGAAGAAIGSCIGSALALLVNSRYGMKILAGASQPIKFSPKKDSWRIIAPAWNPTAFRDLLWICLPLGVMTTLNSLNVNVPRYFIQRLFGEEQLGIFSAATYPIVAVITVAAAVGQAASPRLATYLLSEQIAAFKALLAKLALVTLLPAALLSLFAFLLGGPFLESLYGEEFGEGAAVLRWAAFLSLLSVTASALNYAALALRRFKGLAVTYALTTLATTVGCFLLVADHGLMGAVAAMGAGAVIQVIGCVVIVHKGVMASNVRAAT